MSISGENEQEADARRVLAYFLHHPETADSIAGLLRWRLLEDESRCGPERNEQALQWLLSKKYLREEPVPGGARVVMLDGSDLRRARRFVAAGRQEKSAGESPEKRTSDASHGKLSGRLH